MSNIIKCENCGCEEIDIIHKYKEYYVCPKCGRDTERLHEIEHDKDIRAKAIDDFLHNAETKICDRILQNQARLDFASGLSVANRILDEIAEQMKVGANSED